MEDIILKDYIGEVNLYRNANFPKGMGVSIEFVFPSSPNFKIKNLSHSDLMKIQRGLDAYWESHKQ